MKLQVITNEGMSLIPSTIVIHAFIMTIISLLLVITPFYYRWFIPESDDHPSVMIGDSSARPASFRPSMKLSWSLWPACELYVCEAGNMLCIGQLFTPWFADNQC